MSPRKISFWPLLFISLTVLVFDLYLVFEAEKEGPARLYNAWHTMENTNVHRYILLWNMFMLFLCGLKLLAFIFFSGLRPTEVEHLIAKTSLSLTDTCLILMLMKATFDNKLLQPLLVLFIMKWGKWVLEDRLEYIESRLNVPRNQIMKIIFVLSAITFINMYQLVSYAFSISRLEPSPSYAFILEYALEVIDILKLNYCYFLFAYEISITNDITFNRQLYILYGNLVATGMSLLCQVNFFFFLVSNMIFPFISVRSFMMNLKDFRKNLKAVVQSRRAIAIMDSQFPIATDEDIANFDTMCIVCREDMQANPAACRKLPCGHILHLTCLRTWFQRQQNCPLCRSSILHAHQNRAANANPAAQNADALIPQPQQIPPGQQNQQPQNPQPNENDPNQNNAGNGNEHRERRPRRHGQNRELPAGENLFYIQEGEQQGQQPDNSNRRRRQSRHATSGNAQPEASGSRADVRSINVDLDLLRSTISSVIDPFVTQPYGIDIPEIPSDMAQVSEEALAELESEMRISACSRIKHLKKIHNMIELTNVMMQTYDRVGGDFPTADATTQASRQNEDSHVADQQATVAASDPSNAANIAIDEAGSMLDELD